VREAEREAGMSLSENFGTCSLRGRPRLVSAAGDGKSSRESELSAVANNARRDEGIVEFTPRGVHSPANIPSPVHSPLWNGNGAGVGESRGAPSITWEIALALFMCVYTDTSRALGHATPRRAIPHVMLRYSTLHYAAPHRAVPQFSAAVIDSPDKEDINNAFCASTRSVCSYRYGRVYASPVIRASDG